jgi:hypothetical protein
MDGCPACRGKKLTDHRDLRGCRSCTHLFQWPPTITARYDAAYVAKYAAYPVTEISYLRLGFVRAFAAGGTLLDVGHCRGDFVRAAAAAGFDAWGHDVHGQHVGVPTIDSLNAAPPDGAAWDVVTFFDSLEHFGNLDPVRRLARRARKIVVSLPWRPESFPASRDWRHYRPGEHLHYFTAQSLAALFDRHRLLAQTNLEDAVRRGPGGNNIATLVFGPI